MKDSIVIYKSWKPLIDSLPDALKIDFYELLWGYDGLEYNPIIDNPHLNGIFQFVLVKIKDNESKYADKCVKASASVRKRWNKDEPSGDTKNTNAYERIKGNTNHTDKDKDKGKESSKEDEGRKSGRAGGQVSASPSDQPPESKKPNQEKGGAPTGPLLWPDEAQVFLTAGFSAYLDKIDYGHVDKRTYLAQCQTRAEELKEQRTEQGWQNFLKAYFNLERANHRLMLPMPFEQPAKPAIKPMPANPRAELWGYNDSPPSTVAEPRPLLQPKPAGQYAGTPIR